jgi:hypothetical protein
MSDIFLSQDYFLVNNTSRLLKMKQAMKMVVQMLVLPSADRYSAADEKIINRKTSV